MKHIALWAVMMLLAGCGGLPLNRSITALSQSSRAEVVVIHYTASDLTTSLKTLTEGPVSAHYLIPAEGNEIYQLVDENRRAWHAGDSQWRGRTWLNASSIGIELVNPGYEDTPNGRRWHPFPDAQIEQLIALLRDIQARHAIEPRNIVGHSDIAPQRKVDPGPAFPWAKLAAAGLIPWPDGTRLHLATQQLNGRLPDATWFQTQLARLGYPVPNSGQWDTATRNLLAAFQMKYRPAQCAGDADLDSAALLLALAEG